MAFIKYCPFCGEKTKQNANNCQGCGKSLGNPSPPPPIPGTQSTTSFPPPPPMPGKRPEASSPPPPPLANNTGASPPSPPRVTSSSVPIPPPPPTNMVSQGNAAPPPPPQGLGSVAQQNFSDPYVSQRASHDLAYDYPKAAIGKRILAYLIDGVIATVPFIVTLPFAGIPLYRYIASNGWVTPSTFTWITIVVGMLISLLWGMFYSFLRDGFGQGQSWGKKACGLMVVRLVDNMPCTKKYSFLRNIVGYGLSIVLSIIPVINFLSSLVEPLVAIFHQKGFRLGDMLAKTQVIEVNNYRR